MILLFNLSIITSILVLGATIATQQGMIFYKVRVWAEERNKGILEPLILCHWCMPSIWSLIGYSFAFGIGELTKLTWHLLFLYPLVVMLSSFICGFSWSLYLLIDRLFQLSTKDENEEQ